MESATFRKWLAERGCRFDQHEHEKRGEGQVIVTAHREGRKAEVPLGGSHQILDARVVRQTCEELGLDWSQLPGPKGATIGSRLSKWNFSTSHPPPSFFFKIPSFDWIVA
jgi:hypothetical protein